MFRWDRNLLPEEMKQEDLENPGAQRTSDAENAAH